MRADLVRSTWIIYQKSYILVIHRIDSIPFRPFGFIAPKTLDYLAFKSSGFEREGLMKVIPETRRVH